VKHQEVHHDIVDKEMRDVDAGTQGRHQEEQREGNQVWRIEPPNSASPKRSKMYILRLTRSARFGPLQMNTKSRDNEKQKDADVAKGSPELQKLHGPTEEVIGNRVWGLQHCVVKHHSHGRNAAKCIDALQTSR
jgi:hypothetical protein